MQTRDRRSLARGQLTITTVSFWNTLVAAMSIGFGASQFYMQQRRAIQDKILPFVLSEEAVPRRVMNNLTQPWITLAESRFMETADASRIRQDTQLKYLLHPTLLAHARPEWIALVLPSKTPQETIDASLEEILWHGSVEHITILIRSDIVDSEEETPKTTIDIPENVKIKLLSVPASTSAAGLRGYLPDHLDVLLMQDFDPDLPNQHSSSRSTERLGLANLRENGMMTMAFAVSVSPEHRMRYLRHLVAHDGTDDKEGVGASYYAMATEYEHPWSPPNNFGVAFQNRVTKAQWHQTEALFNLRWHQRIRQRQLPEFKVDASLVMDSALMTSLEFPSKVTEASFCEYFEEDCEEGMHGLDPVIPNVPQADLRVAKSGMGEHSGRGVFATYEIKKVPTYLALETNCRPVRANWKTMELIWEFLEENSLYQEMASILEYYLDGYGFIDEPWGVPEWTVEASVLTFANHGCNSTYNIGIPTPLNEWTIDLEKPPLLEVAYHDFDRYNPLQERDMTKLQWIAKTNKPIQAGGEILENYLGLSGALEHFVTNVKELRAQCAGDAGAIEEYETSIQ